MKGPRDSFLVSKSWICRVYRVSDTAFTKWGIKSKEKRGRIVLWDARDVQDYRTEKPDSATGILSKERAEFTRQQRIRLEREEAVKTGLLLSAETVAGEWCNLFVVIRQRLLNAAARIEQIAEEEISEIVRSEIHSALDDLAGYGAGRYPPADPGNVPRADKGNGRGVGRSKPGIKRGGRRRTGKVAH